MVQELRSDLEPQLRKAPNLVTAAQRFVEMFTRSFDTVALARLFIVARYDTLAVPEQDTAAAFAKRVGRGTLESTTPVLSLLGTSGALPSWNRREKSNGHRAIPFLDRSLVDGAPMIAALLSSLNVDLVALRGDPAVQLRHLSGGLNARFYVPDARSTLDARGRHIIAAQDFVQTQGIRTVFGMGGAYMDGKIVVAIMFTRELLAELYVDRFPSFIGTFKLATSALASSGLVY